MGLRCLIPTGRLCERPNALAITDCGNQSDAP